MRVQWNGPTPRVLVRVYGQFGQLLTTLKQGSDALNPSTMTGTKIGSNGTIAGSGALGFS